MTADEHTTRGARADRLTVPTLTPAEQRAATEAAYWTTAQFAAIRNHLIVWPRISEATARRWAANGTFDDLGVEVVAVPGRYLINADQWLAQFASRLHGAHLRTTDLCAQRDGRGQI